MRSVCFAASEAEGARRSKATRSSERGPEGNIKLFSVPGRERQETGD